MLPFTREQFLGVFTAYHEAVGVAPAVLNLAAVAALVLALRPSAVRSRWIAALLAGSWLWMGLVYHVGFFRSINPAAIGFGAAFVLQGSMFAAFAWRGGVTFGLQTRNASGRAAAVLALYALLVYPLLGLGLGHRYPAAPTFGLPCPTTIFTLAMLLWAEGGAPKRLIVIPVVWSAIGTSAAIHLGMTEDLGLGAAGLAVLVLRLVDPARRSRAPRSSGPRHGGAACASGPALERSGRSGV